MLCTLSKCHVGIQVNIDVACLLVVLVYVITNNDNYYKVDIFKILLQQLFT